jgi:hypothetical protein
MSNEADNNNNNNNNNNSDNIQQQPIIKDNESDIQEELSEPLSPTEVIIDDEPAPAAGIPTYNLGDPPVPHDGRRGSDTYATRLAMEERREMLEEKLWDKYMRNMMMMIINMQRMMGAQTLMIGDPSEMHAGIGAIREELARLLKDYGRTSMTTIQKEITSYMKAFRQRKESTLLKPTGENAQGR